MTSALGATQLPQDVGQDGGLGGPYTPSSGISNELDVTGRGPGPWLYAVLPSSLISGPENQREQVNANQPKAQAHVLDRLSSRIFPELGS